VYVIRIHDDSSRFSVTVPLTPIGFASVLDDVAAIETAEH